jgi:hypothetical protein
MKISEIAITTATIGILVLMILLLLGLDDSLKKIEAKLDSPAIPRTSVIHGFYQDQRDPKNSGLRMIRVARDGTLVVMPLMPPKTPKAPEKKDDPGK